MTASSSSRSARLAGVGLVALALCACASDDPPSKPRFARASYADVLEPMGPASAHPPEAADRVAARIAAAALASRRDLIPPALQELQALEEQERRELELAEERSGVAGDVIGDPARERVLYELAYDVANATLDHPDTYREASEELLDDGDVHPAHESRLEQSVKDDPLDLADDRVLDNYESLWAHAFNAIAVPLGRSAITGLTIAPYTISQSVIHWLAAMWERPTISTPERQALVHWRRYIAENPDSPEVPELEEKIDKAQAKLDRHWREHYLRGAQVALDRGQPRLARAQAIRAVALTPDHTRSNDLLAEADARIARLDGLRANGLYAPSPVPADADARSLAWSRALLSAPAEQAFVVLRRAQREEADGPLADEIAFALGGLALELGSEASSWAQLEQIARKDPRSSNMARHAGALLSNPWQNPYGSFQVERSRAARRTWSHRFFGHWAARPRYQSMPRLLAYLIDAPAIAQTVVTAPVRVILAPWQPAANFQKPVAAAGYRYLSRFPEGEHRRELIGWLVDYEAGRENYALAARLIDYDPALDPEKRAELVEQAAEQELSGAQRARRRDLRSSLLRGVIREYPDSVAGHEAGMMARHELTYASAQRIRLTRGYLQENRAVAGPGGLGLDPLWIDGRAENGELHPAGVTFLGGRLVEFALLDPESDWDEEAAPLFLREEVSKERLARTISRIEETSILAVQLDADDDQKVDASRDLFFERARLGLVEEVDVRPTAHSTYVYQSLRERYGMVRGRESILPFDLVLQGSFRDLSLGAFPRWRQPKPTPDAFLYR